jgi:hypothetical protein
VNAVIKVRHCQWNFAALVFRLPLANTGNASYALLMAGLRARCDVNFSDKFVLVCKGK